MAHTVSYLAVILYSSSNKRVIYNTHTHTLCAAYIRLHMANVRILYTNTCIMYSILHSLMVEWHLVASHNSRAHTYNMMCVSLCEPIIHHMVYMQYSRSIWHSIWFACYGIQTCIALHCISHIACIFVCGMHRSVYVWYSSLHSSRYWYYQETNIEYAVNRWVLAIPLYVLYM